MSELAIFVLDRSSFLLKTTVENAMDANICSVKTFQDMELEKLNPEITVYYKYKCKNDPIS